MYRLLPLFFLLAVSPESDKKLEQLNYFITATKDTVTNIRNGIDTFHAAMVPFINTQGTEKNPPEEPSLEIKTDQPLD